MPKFKILVPTEGWSEYTVEADDIESAFEAVRCGEADMNNFECHDCGIEEDWEGELCQ